MMPDPITHVLLIAAVSMALLLLVLAALAGLVNLLIKLFPERAAPRKAEIEKNQPSAAPADGEALDQIAAVIGIALARARSSGERSRRPTETLRAGTTPWRDISRHMGAGYFDRGWRPR